MGPKSPSRLSVGRVLAHLVKAPSLCLTVGFPDFGRAYARGRGRGGGRGQLQSLHAHVSASGIDDFMSSSIMLPMVVQNWGGGGVHCTQALNVGDGQQLVEFFGSMPVFVQRGLRQKRKV